jgi:hypothetical protein
VLGFGEASGGVDAQFVTDAYHRVFHIEKSFRMSKHDLRAGRSHHHKVPRSRRTCASCSPRWPSPDGSRPDRLAGQEVRAYHPHAAAPSTSKPANTLTAVDHNPTTYARR